ncbi:class II fructose-1,6-bisphosphate aldolase [Mycoplasmoides pirum]|uniref:class II fructose-1,6-bisphosphate aldolase n=1 Tax=Mycoplasmoides pirum TaxID=2122 RepID=UPI0005684D0D|nr:class II fructose-1,6-bisphosphate aldolase [Mycoplasmoides pirum]
MTLLQHSTRLVNANSIIEKAHKEKYAIAHININNLEWTKSVLEAAQETKTPVILGVSEGAVKYMGGYKLIHCLVSSLLDSMDITIPVVLHLDHGSYDGTFKALDAGFTSVMFDGSHLPFNENLEKSQKVVEYAIKHNASVELETGTIGGEEDGVIGQGELADPEECKKLVDLKNVTMLAAGFGNIHGLYPENWKGLDFECLKNIHEVTNTPLVLHGGSGIPNEQVEKAISLGISKVNVNTECQLAFAEATRKYIMDNKDLDYAKKGYDPRKLLKPGCEAIKKTCIEKFTLFKSIGKA